MSAADAALLEPAAVETTTTEAAVAASSSSPPQSPSSAPNFMLLTPSLTSHQVIYDAGTFWVVDIQT